MKVLSLFSGIGAFEKALDNLQIPYELAGFSEIDKYAVKSYCAIHGVDESMNLGDITKIDEKAGKCLMLKITEYHRTEREYLLSQSERI